MTSVRVAARVLFALCLGAVFLLVCLCLSDMPDVLRGPIGFKSEPPAVLVVIKEVVPTTWAALIGGVLFGVITFRHGVARGTPPLMSALALLCLMVCMGLSCAWLIIRDHAVYAVDPVQTSNFRIAANFVLLAILGLLASMSPSGQCAPSNTSPSHGTAQAP